MKKTLKKILELKIPKNKIDFINRAFEVVGDIAICEISKEVENYEKIIGDTILKSNSSIKVVLKKVSHLKVLMKNKLFQHQVSILFYFQYTLFLFFSHHKEILIFDI